MVGIPRSLVVVFIALPTILSIVLSFTSGTASAASTAIECVGLENYVNLGVIPTSHPRLPALLAGAPAQPHLAGVLPASSPRRSGCSSRSCWTRTSAAPASTRARCTCRSCCRWPSSASSGILIYAPDQGLLNNVLGTNQRAQLHRLAGQPRHQPLGRPRRRQLAPHRLRHGALPGRPEGRRPQPARGRRRSTAPTSARPSATSSSRCCEPINVVVLVITVIESLRAFDLAYIINKGPQRPGAALGPRHQQHHR